MYALDFYVYYGQIHRLHMNEIMKAKSRIRFAQMKTRNIRQQEQIEAALEQASLLVRQHAKFLANPDANIIERAVRHRDKMLQHEIQEQFDKDKEIACRLASIAFLHKDYRRVIELLMPFEKYLSLADSRRLALAQKILYPSRIIHARTSHGSCCRNYRKRPPGNA